MNITYDRKTFFDSVRKSLFGGSMSQSQVEGMSYILHMWEQYYPEGDTRWLGYCLATTKHETAEEMQPIEEYGKGEGMAYGKVDPETGQTYYGRGYVQVTWRENYAKTDKKLKLSKAASTEWHADNMLDPTISAMAMFQGMEEGWFRSDAAGPQNLGRYFYGNYDDPWTAREIINGDKSRVPNWSTQNIGSIVKGYYMDFTAALNAARRTYPLESIPEPEAELVVRVTIVKPPGVKIEVNVEEVPA